MTQSIEHKDGRILEVRRVEIFMGERQKNGQEESGILDRRTPEYSTDGRVLNRMGPLEYWTK
jgi:hypothetical protein